MISTICWVPRGTLLPLPLRVEVTEEDMKNLAPEQHADDMEEDVNDAPPDAKEGGDKKAGNTDDLMNELDLDNYDNEESGVQMMLGGRNLTVFTDNLEDPYITVDDPDYESDEEDAKISASDFVLLAGHTEQEYSSAEVHIFEKEKSNVYVHHDIVLPSFPLAFAYIQNDQSQSDGKEGSARNLIAVGTFEPAIELWNLDSVDAIEPVAALGGRNPPQAGAKKKSRNNKKRKGKNKTKGLKDEIYGSLKKGSHKLGVMSLSWNTKNRACIASGSADHTAKLWDIPNTTCTLTLNHHRNKVQCLAWNPAEAPFLLTGSYDQQCAVVDVRDSKTVKFYKVDGEVQDVSWNPNNPAIFAVASDSGNVMFYDVRKSGHQTKPLFTIGAHDGEVSSVSFNAKYPHMLATGGVDETVKIWDLSSSPVCLEKKDLKIGKVFSMAFNSEDPDILAAGGSAGKVGIWDCTASEVISSKYKKLL